MNSNLKCPICQTKLTGDPSGLYCPSGTHFGATNWEKTWETGIITSYYVFIDIGDLRYVLTTMDSGKRTKLRVRDWGLWGDYHDLIDVPFIPLPIEGDQIMAEDLIKRLLKLQAFV